MYEEEKFSKMELTNEINLVTEKMEEYKQSVERLENKVNKKDHELE
jgi:hypothetical protein